MLLEHYPCIPRIIREEKDIDPERVTCRWEIENGSQLFHMKKFTKVHMRRICEYADEVPRS